MFHPRHFLKLQLFVVLALTSQFDPGAAWGAAPVPSCPYSPSIAACDGLGVQKSLSAIWEGCTTLARSYGLNNVETNQCLYQCVDRTQKVSTSCLVVAPNGIPQYCYLDGTMPNHCDPAADNRYDILQANCHSAANSCVVADPTHSGIIICNWFGHVSNISGHTFNYRMNDDFTSTTYWNWGTPCGPCAGKPPVDFVEADACHGTCVAEACGSQVETRNALSEGTTIAIPGPTKCVNRYHFWMNDPSMVDSCMSCCDDEADTFPNTAGTDYQRNCNRESFRTLCKSKCDSFFKAATEPVACPFSPSVRACTSKGLPRPPSEIVSDCTVVLARPDYAALPAAERRSCMGLCLNRSLSKSSLCSTPTPVPDPSPTSSPEEESSSTPTPAPTATPGEGGSPIPDASEEPISSPDPGPTIEQEESWFEWFINYIWELLFGAGEANPSPSPTPVPSEPPAEQPTPTPIPESTSEPTPEPTVEPSPEPDPQ